MTLSQPSYNSLSFFLLLDVIASTYFPIYLANCNPKLPTLPIPKIATFYDMSYYKWSNKGVKALNPEQIIEHASFSFI